MELLFMVPSQERGKQAGSTSIAKLSPNVDENKLGLSCRGLGVGGMDELGGGNTYIYIGLHFMVLSQAELDFLFCHQYCRAQPQF